jgi:chromate transport protein ChrA
LIALFAPILDRLRRNRTARGALDGMNAAVVSLIVVVAGQLALANFRSTGTLHFDLIHVAIFAAALIILLCMKVNATWIIIVAGLIGVIRSLV